MTFSTIRFLYFISELGKQVKAVYVECLEALDQEVTTMDLLKRIELRMEMLTQELERLPSEKVKIAQRVSLSRNLFLPFSALKTSIILRSRRHTFDPIINHVTYHDQSHFHSWDLALKKVARFLSSLRKASSGLLFDPFFRARNDRMLI